MRLSEIIARLEREWEAEISACRNRIERGHSDSRELRFQNEAAIKRWAAEIEYARHCGAGDAIYQVPSCAELEAELAMMCATRGE